MPVNPIAELETMRRIALRHGFTDHARLVEDLLSRGASEPAGIWEALDTNDVWGGAGSLADISLSANSSLPEAEVRADELAWRNAFIALSEGMLANGIRNPRAESCASAFRIWNDGRVGI
jgi:hypothetical protein